MKFGAPDWIRTSGLCLRRAALYPAELRVPDGPPSKANRGAPDVFAIRPRRLPDRGLSGEPSLQALGSSAAGSWVCTRTDR